MKPIVITKAKETSQIKPQLGQERAGSRCKIKTQISKLLMQVKENPALPNTSNIQDIAVPIPYFATLQVKPKDDTSTKIIDRKTIQDVGREILIYPDPVYRPPPKPVKTSIPNIPRSISDIDPELAIDFKDNSPFQEGDISKRHQRPDK